MNDQVQNPEDRLYHWSVRPKGYENNDDRIVYKIEATEDEIAKLKALTGASALMYCSLTCKPELISQDELDFKIDNIREATAALELLTLHAKPDTPVKYKKRRT